MGFFGIFSKSKDSKQKKKTKKKDSELDQAVEGVQDAAVKAVAPDRADNMRRAASRRVSQSVVKTLTTDAYLVAQMQKKAPPS